MAQVTGAKEITPTEARKLSRMGKIRAYGEFASEEEARSYDYFSSNHFVLVQQKDGRDKTWVLYIVL